MWRPDSWEEVKPQSPHKDWGGESFNVGVEAGADAMLRAVVAFIGGVFSEGKWKTLSEGVGKEWEG